MNDHKLISDLEGYIIKELYDSLYYKALAEKAPTRLAKEILMEFCRDEKSHAESFMEAYHHLTGKVFESPPEENIHIPCFEEALKNRMLEETNDYKIYGKQYVDASCKHLKDLFFMAKISEGLHAMRIPLLFEEIKESPS